MREAGEIILQGVIKAEKRWVWYNYPSGVLVKHPQPCEN